MSSERPKQTAFRLPQRTLDILDKIIEEGTARTRTEALIWAVDSTRDLVSKDDVVKAMEEARWTMEEAKKQQMEQRHRIEELEDQMKALAGLMKLYGFFTGKQSNDKEKEPELKPENIELAMKIMAQEAPDIGIISNPKKRRSKS